MKKFVPVAVALLMLCRAADSCAAASRPNVLIVMTDDQGLGDFSFMGNPVLKTPNMDRLAQESVRLTDFHVCPMCSPTRGQLMTGVTALRNGATSVTAGRTFLRPDIPTMPQLFADAGYKTGLFGKWHLGDSYPHRPIDKGFQESVYHLGWGMLNSTPEFDNPLFDGRYYHSGEPKQFTGHCTDWWFDQAINWMKRRKDNGEPFFCYIPTNAPHAPFVERDEFVAPYQGKGPAGFFGMIAHVDQRLGDLDRFLTDSGLRDDTLVIFMTDNGGTAGVKTFNAGLRAGKTTYYDGGHRVPCWIRWPNGKLGEPRDIDVPTQNTDLLPTLKELCNISPEHPGFTQEELRVYGGESLVPLLRDGRDNLLGRTLIVQYGQIPTKFDCCIIRDQWRLVKGDELYDVVADRAQEKNVAIQFPEVVTSLREYYENWWIGIEHTLESFVPISIGAKQQPVVELTSGDWEGIYADNTGHVRTAVGGPKGGHWHIQVETRGRYEFTFRRWPEQTKLALGDRYDAKDGGPNSMSKDFPNIAQLHSEIAGLTAIAKADPKQTGVALTAFLQPGRTTLKAWFQDASGQDLCGAFFVTVRKLSN